MIIKCETCGSVYCIADKFIYSSERKVKCSKCNHVWNVKVNNSNLTSSFPSEITASWPLQNYLNKFLSILLILINLFLFHRFWSEVPIVEKIYQYFGYQSSDNFRLDNINFTMENGTIFVNGSLTNVSDSEYNLPLIRFRLLDRDKKTLFQQTNEKKDIKLAPGEQHLINVNIINLTENDAYLVLDYGNKIELMLNK